MQGWEQQSLFGELIAEEQLVADSFRTHRRRSGMGDGQRAALLQEVAQALELLKLFIAAHDLESHWVSQLLDYVQRLQAATPAQTPEEQFSHMYMLRKWLNWVPVSLLRQQGGKGPAMLTLAHFYATALTLEPLFPDLGASFCSAMALQPLEAIISVTTAMQSTPGSIDGAHEIATTMHFAEQAAFNYRFRAPPEPPTAQDPYTPEHQTIYMAAPESLAYGNLSPAFAPATPAPTAPQYYTPPPPSNTASPFLEVPMVVSQNGFGYGTSSWGAMPSPAFNPITYATQTQDEEIFGIADGFSLGGQRVRGGFVSPMPVWI